MQYVGGKEKSGGAQIAKLINAVVKRDSLSSYCEPFVGGLSVLRRIQCPQRVAQDACEALITLYRAIQGGWEPPRELSREQWETYRTTQDPNDPMTAFAGFGCSTFGSWFQAYVKRYKYTDRYVSGAEAAANSLARKMKTCMDVTFASGDYRTAPEADITYCDPPYRGTLGYGAVPEWDPDAFWDWARTRSGLLAVSEMQAPEDFTPALSLNVQHRIATGSGKRRQEFLWVHESQKERWGA